MSCTCDKLRELYEWRTDFWGKRWRLDVTDTGSGYLIVDGDGMTVFDNL